MMEHEEKYYYFNSEPLAPKEGEKSLYEKLEELEKFIEDLVAEINSK